MGTKKRAEGFVEVPGRASHPTSVRHHLPGPIQHSTAMLHLQVAGEGRNNKEFAP